MQDSFLDEGFILDKKIGVGQPKRVTDAKVLIANTPMDTDKIKIYGARVRVDSMAKARPASNPLCTARHCRPPPPVVVVGCRLPRMFADWRQECWRLIRIAD